MYGKVSLDASTVVLTETGLLGKAAEELELSE